ncbi:MAG: phosphate transporter [Chitinophagaceae bacterium]|nr:phosphate transporter [Chitinophagaceae bacterium]
MFPLFLTVVICAFIFDFINGFHDAANSIATVVSTKVLSPLQAVLWAAFFNVVAAFLFDLKVADAVASIVKTSAIDLWVILAGLLAAIIWNLLTWWYGIPSSSSHTLMGGFAGAAIAKAGLAGLGDIGKIYTTFFFIFLAPLIGLLIAFVITILLAHLAKNSNPYRAEKWFKRSQLISSAAFSIGHGANDAQKVMGVLAAAVIIYAGHLYTTGTEPAWLHIKTSVNAVTGKTSIKDIPLWIKAGCYAAMGFGTMSGGWKIIKTMGTRITKVTPFEGVSAETAGAITLFITHALGVPVSTTHTISGSIMGVGATKRLSAVRWGVTINLLWAWLLTIPVSALLAAIFFYIFKLFA